MRRSHATRYARWSALTALLIVVVVTAIYARRAWQQSRARKLAPLALPVTVTQRSATFAFSKVEGDRTLFTVRASHATEFKEGNKNLLEDVWITVYGRAGARFDNLHTQQCDYLRDSGRVVCKGEVQIDLESAEEAKQPASHRGIRVVTSNLSFDRQTGEAHSEQPVTFRFPYGDGRAVGVNYSSGEAAVRLLRDVELSLNQNPGGRAGEPTVLSAAGLEYRRETHVMRLAGPVHARQGAREINAGLITLELSPALRARRITAAEKPQLISREPQGQVTLVADSFTTNFAADGTAERMIAAGGVHGTRRPTGPASGEDHFAADRMEMEFTPGNNQPKLLSVTGNVKVDSVGAPAAAKGAAGREPGTAAGTRHLETASLQLHFASRARGTQTELMRGETLSPARLELSSPLETTRLRGERLEAEYAAHNRIERITGRQGVELERRLPGHSPQITQSQDGTLEFGTQGDWTEAKQSGNVRFREGERTAHADRARLIRASDTLTLTGAAVIADSQSETAAPTIVLNQRTGEISGDGGVRTTYRKAEVNGVTNLAPQPAHISAQRVVAGRETGKALYSGRARLWQGDAVIEGDTLELRRDDRVLVAQDNVRAIFPQSALPPAPQGAASQPPPASAGKETAPAASPTRTLWRASAGRLTYAGADSVVFLEGHVHAESALAQIDSPSLQLILNSAGGAAGAGKQLTRALAAGGVTVRQEDRRGTAEKAEYVVADGKFVLSGGNPTLYDAAQGTTTGRQLTFFLADDRILVESSEGTRTLTRHRIQK
jgi:lipopolysaccharide export system protein LptA